MKKTSAIVKISIVSVILVIGLILSFVSMKFGLYDYKSFSSTIKLGLDLKGGIFAVYEADETGDDFSASMEGTRVNLQNMLVGKGFTEASIVREGTNRIRVEVPDVDSPDAILKIIGKPASIRFVLDETSEEVLTGKHVIKAGTTLDQEGNPAVELSLNSEGTKKFADATTNNTGKTMSIYVSVEGEEDQKISTATINEAIVGGKAIISGSFSDQEAEDLANQIMSGTFAVKLRLIENNTISPTLGDEALKLGLIAGAIGLFLVMVFMCFVYRGFGGVASFCLLFYVVLMMFFLAVLPWVQLTLPGIAGIILSLGMAVDANVIIYERIKDEYRNGKSILASTYAGFKKATIAIIDSNITTIIASIFLLIFGTGPIKGFAITLLVGIILSLFTSLLLTRAMVRWVVRINSNDPKAYNLKRGKGYENISADQTDVTIAEAMEKEIQEKDNKKAAKKRKNENKDKGGLANNENI